jgi:hypothetical protein
MRLGIFPGQSRQDDKARAILVSCPRISGSWVRLALFRPSRAFQALKSLLGIPVITGHGRNPTLLHRGDGVPRKMICPRPLAGIRSASCAPPCRVDARPGRPFDYRLHLEGGPCGPHRDANTSRLEQGSWLTRWRCSGSGINTSQKPSYQGVLGKSHVKT